MTKPVTVRERVESLLRTHKTYRAASMATGVSVTSLYCIFHGMAEEETLQLRTVRRLGLKCGPKFDIA